MNGMLERTLMLLGENQTKTLVNFCVCVVGLGGVGGASLECLIRCGVKKVIIIDFDQVSESNLNRQILYTKKETGINKVEAAKMRAQSINPDVEIIVFNEFLSNETLIKLSAYKIDYLIDAIDSMNAKCELIKYCLDKEISFISSLGMANRIDASQISVMRLDKTYNCPLAKKLRTELRKQNIDIKRVTCVFSREEPLVSGAVPSSMMMVPVTAGLIAVSHMINLMMKKENNE